MPCGTSSSGHKGTSATIAALVTNSALACSASWRVRPIRPAQQSLAPTPIQARNQGTMVELAGAD